MSPLDEISRDVREWLQLARRQRKELPINGPVTPTEAAIQASERRLADLYEWEKQFKAAIQEIVCTEGEDAGVVLLSQEAPSTYDKERKCHVYELKYFSPLGNALMRLWKLANGNAS